MRFDQLVMTIQGEELRLRFHPALTILCGLGPDDRDAFADSLMSALAAGPETSALRYVDSSGRSATLVCRGGQASARYDDDGSPAPTPVGSVAASAAELRALMLVHASELGVLVRDPLDDEPDELREARSTLVELSAELDDVRSQQRSLARLRAQLRQLDKQIAEARDGEARRAYALVLADLDRVRAEADAVHTSATGIETDRRLLAAASEATEQHDRWERAAQHHAELTARIAGDVTLSPDEVAAAALLPDRPPAGIGDAVRAVQQARNDCDALDARLQELAVATLPAPSDPMVVELGLLDQDQLWTAANRLIASSDEVEQLHVTHGGFAVDDDTSPAVIREIERAHAAVEDAVGRARARALPGAAGVAAGVGLAAVGGTGGLVPLMGAGGLVAALAAGALLIAPRGRVVRAGRAERTILSQADAPSYLSFHIRRVDASVDPQVRDHLERAREERHRAAAAWADLVGPEADVRHAVSLEADVRAYHQAVVDLGGAAEEIIALRHELERRAGPALVAAIERLHELCEPYGLGDITAAHLGELGELIAKAIERGRVARVHLVLDDARADAAGAARELETTLERLGFHDELDLDLDADDAERAERSLRRRYDLLTAALSAAADRERDRSRARSAMEIEAELADLTARARSMRRPEWASVTAADANAPDVASLEQRRSELLAQIDDAGEVRDVDRLADRCAAVERRVRSLEARHGAVAANGDPGAVADIQQHLLARLTTAGTAGPHGDPVPVVLDEAFLLVPADRKWDLLDMLRRLAERHQIVYLSDDPFVAAWARQQVADGNVTLLELDPAEL